MTRRSKKAAPSRPTGVIERVKALPWTLMLEAAFVVGRRWRALSDKDRARLARLVRESGGRPSTLGARERRELHSLVGKFGVKRVIRELVLLARGPARRRRRRR